VNDVGQTFIYLFITRTRIATTTRSTIWKPYADDAMQSTTTPHGSCHRVHVVRVHGFPKHVSGAARRSYAPQAISLRNSALGDAPIAREQLVEP